MTAAKSLVDPRIEHQRELEELYDKNQLMKRIREAFKACESVPFAAQMADAGIDERFGFDLLAHMAVRKRADVPTLIGCLRHHCESDQEVAYQLERAVAIDLVDYSVREKLFIVCYEISPELQAELDRFQFPLPMVVPPLPVQSNLDTGYITERASVILRNNYHEDDVCLDHINRLNKTSLSLNLDVARTIQNKWRGLDKQKPDESWQDFQRRRKAFNKYDRVAKDVISLLLQEGNQIYLTHRYDKRGRTYCVGFHINYQGTDWNKAIIEFSHKELVED